jgi:hypothetical protein
MWIDNYDDPEEMTLEEALELLRQNGYINCSEQIDKSIMGELTEFGEVYVFRCPARESIHICINEDAVIELVIDNGLEYIEPNVITVQ